MTTKKEISLEEKLRKLAEDKKKEDKKPEAKKEEKKQETPIKSEEREPVKERLPVFESAVVPITSLNSTEESKDAQKTENLERAVSEVQTPIPQNKKENEQRLYNVLGNQGHIGKYQSNDAGSDGKYHPVKLTERNLSRDRPQPVSPNLMSGKLLNPFDHSDRNTYMNAYSTEIDKGEQDSARMYEETKERLYETSQRDIHKRPNKNI